MPINNIIRISKHLKNRTNDDVLYVRDSILQDMAQHLPRHRKCACRAYCVNVEVTVWEFRGSVTDHLKFLAPDVTIDDGSVCHISLE